MAFGFAVLKCSSEELWAMTPREMALAMTFFSQGEADAMPRQDFDALMRRFPDQKDR